MLVGRRVEFGREEWYGVGMGYGRVIVVKFLGLG